VSVLTSLALAERRYQITRANGPNPFPRWQAVVEHHGRVEVRAFNSLFFARRWVRKALNP
jgi:hypothetical protein